MLRQVGEKTSRPLHPCPALSLARVAQCWLAGSKKTVCRSLRVLGGGQSDRLSSPTSFACSAGDDAESNVTKRPQAN